MSDAAHVGSFDHDVYRKPFAVKPPTELRDRLSNYVSYEGGDKLPEKMNVWLVQKTGEKAASVVSSSNGFEDGDDTEIIALGHNVGKYYGAVGIGRDGNFLQWGYHAPPSQMTAAGKKLFINCIKYISSF